MTIGPAPMISTLLMSLRFGIFHHLGETIEEVPDIVRPRTRLGVSLKTKRRPIRPREALEGTVEERNMGRSEVFTDGRRIHCEAVILAGDHHLPGVEVLHRM